MLGPADQLDNDIELTSGLNGLFVGQLDESETNAFNRLVDRGLARGVYVGAGGFMGLAKVDIDRNL